MTTSAQWLIIVHRDKPDLYAKLRQSFNGASLVDVMFDRRQGDRRREREGTPTDRRRRDRRRPPSHRETSPEAHFRLIQQADGYLVFQAEGRVPVRCPECDAALEFEMPRFSEPPARLSVAVVHTQPSRSTVQHYAEVEAFKATGRSFLACRILARRENGGGAVSTSAESVQP
ncbi:MAG: hypothetical protein ACRELA_04530, partial [Candidatus Rokuibacteriota bacterium]